jgi:hypothetical protein
LDLWLPVQNHPDAAVHRCLVKWSDRYPNHRFPPLVEPFEISSMTMVQFPDADVSILTDTGTVEHVTEETRIDILFGLPGFEFTDAFENGARSVLGGESVRVLSKDLLGPTAALKRQ